MAMFTGYFEVSVNFNVENRREKFIILISILYVIYSILIRSQFLLCFLRELIMSILNKITMRKMKIGVQGRREGGRGNLPRAPYLIGAP